jgi:hypothetical protein
VEVSLEERVKDKTQLFLADKNADIFAASDSSSKSRKRCRVITLQRLKTYEPIQA